MIQEGNACNSISTRKFGCIDGLENKAEHDMRMGNKLLLRHGKGISARIKLLQTMEG